MKSFTLLITERSKVCGKNSRCECRKCIVTESQNCLVQLLTNAPHDQHQTLWFYFIKQNNNRDASRKRFSIKNSRKLNLLFKHIITNILTDDIGRTSEVKIQQYYQITTSSSQCSKGLIICSKLIQILLLKNFISFQSLIV